MSHYTLADILHPPSLNDIMLGVSRANAAAIANPEWPLHIKPLRQRIDFTRVLRLPVLDQLDTEWLRHANRYLSDPNMYDPFVRRISARDVHKARISAAHAA